MRCANRPSWLFAAAITLSAAPLGAQCREARLGWEPFPDADGVFHSDVAVDGDTAAVARKATGLEPTVTLHVLTGGEWVHTQSLSTPFGWARCRAR